MPEESANGGKSGDDPEGEGVAALIEEAAQNGHEDAGGKGPDGDTDAGQECGVALCDVVHAVGEGEDDEASPDKHLQEEEEHGGGDGIGAGCSGGGEQDEESGEG